MQFEVEGGVLEVSAKHNIATGMGEFHFADELEHRGIWGVGGVRKVSKAINVGKYSPKTTTNNYFVYVGQQKVLAHCFAHIRNPQRY